jgi:hypothetical protein
VIPGPSDPRLAKRVPERVLPAVELDMSGGELPAAGSRVAVRVPDRVLPPVEIDMSAPDLVVSVHLSRSSGPESPTAAARDVLLLADALSEYEISRGGRGLRIADVRTNGRMVVLTLSPVAVAGAGDRLAELATVLRKTVADQFATAAESIEASLQRAAASPTGKLAFARAGLGPVSVEICP